VLLIVMNVAMYVSLVEAQEYLEPPLLPKTEKQLFKQWERVASTRGKAVKESLETEGLYLNQLINSSSPYLLQHAFHPVNWKPWSTDVFNSAKSSGHLIVLSIGYSTCHWCHVMARESFSDEEVATAINKDFLAIKVDREELPNIDHYYKSLLEVAKGTAGWPITVVIDSNGTPIFIDSYLTKQQLLNLLPRLAKLWRDNPSFLLATGKMLENSLSKSDVNRGSDKKLLALDEVIERLSNNFDSVNGGAQGNTKFPNEVMLNFLINSLRWAEPSNRISELNNNKVANFLEGTLEMISSRNLRDHIEGGFHRYATDSEWLVPHFEKMLYNQAQLSLVMLEYSRFSNQESYLNIVNETLSFILRAMYHNDKGFYSALDAELEQTEGGFHTFSKIELESLDLNLEGVVITPFKDRFIVSFVDANTKSKAIMQLHQQLLTIRQSRASLHRDEKIITSWNALTVKAFARSYIVQHNQEHLSISKQIAERLWHRFDKQEGTLMRLSDDSNKTPYLLLEDYAFLADAFIELYDATSDRLWLNRATTLYGVLEHKFYQDDGTLLASYPHQAGIANVRLLDDEVMTPAAVVVEVAEKLHRRGTLKAPEKRIPQLLNRLTSVVNEQPQATLALADALYRLKFGSRQSVRYFAQGFGKVVSKCMEVVSNRCNKMSFDIQLAEGWHINSTHPKQDYLLPTVVQNVSDTKIEYPAERLVKLGFEKEPLSVFEGSFSIKLYKQKDFATQVIELPLQACSDSICLQPERLSFRF